MEERTEAEVKPKFVSPRPLFNQPVELHVTPPPYSVGSSYVYEHVFIIHMYINDTQPP
jgi:hypothetical protein